VHTESADEESQQGYALHFIPLIKFEGSSLSVNAKVCRNVNIGGSFMLPPICKWQQ
jgi:hypothetical protein